MNKNIHYLLAGLAVVYVAFALFFALPYRFFPAGDLAAYKLIGSASFGEAFRSVSPVHSFYLLFCAKVWGVFSSNGPSSLVFASALANAVCVFLCGTLVYLLCASRFAALSVAFVYALSAWPLHYLFTYSFAPFSALLTLGALNLLIAGCAAMPRSHWRALAGGLAAGLLFWAAPSGPLAFGAMLVFLFALCRPANRPNLLFWCVFMLGALPAILAFVPCSARPLFEALRENMYAGHYAAALDKFGQIPAVHMIFLRTLWAFGAPLAVALVAIFLLRVAAFLREEPRRLNALWADRPILSALLAYILFYAAVLEFLPLSAVARAQFPLYGAALVMLVAFFFYLRDALPAVRLAAYDKLKWPVLVLLAAGGLFGAMDSRMARRFAPDYMDSLFSKAQVVVLQEDPHSQFLLSWLGGSNIKAIASAELAGAAEAAGNDGLYLLLGPAGPASGVSVLGSCVLEDYSPALEPVQLLLARAPVMLLPYYSVSVPELLETPVCQALFLKGLMPRSEAAARGLTLYHLLSVSEKKTKISKEEAKHVR